MAQADPAIIARAFTNLGARIPLISNHPTVQKLDQAQNFQEEVRGQFRRHDEQFTQLQRTLDGVERGLEEMRREFRLSLNQISREFSNIASITSIQHILWKQSTSPLPSWSASSGDHPGQLTNIHSARMPAACSCTWASSPTSECYSYGSSSTNCVVSRCLYLRTGRSEEDFFFFSMGFQLSYLFGADRWLWLSARITLSYCLGSSEALEKKRAERRSPERVLCVRVGEGCGGRCGWGCLGDRGGGGGGGYETTLIYVDHIIMIFNSNSAEQKTESQMDS
ncbi:uncharacterized protein H6S33_008520 [Morchella sextelata]|uniref:uncharacterized protein n=1 Tax=Morchella sextelata TaxID=1174677 RepID=UPI001D04B217|nr:uncharacterized protein H6S33_008520 [Morchella sextelata]KAH0602870.1 hypothetical protein H6S33_008520 [Morchella sextelata]